MKNALKIYFKDMSNIRTNIIAFIVIIGLSILPALYAWFNIKSSWDPYGNLSDISIGVVNEDIGATLSNKPINIGEIAVENLKNNKTLNFKFVNKEEAKKGLESGKYYASIEITKDFSENILSFLKGTPNKPRLIYKVNEKRNAVAPKITEKSATLLQQEISKNFIDEASKAAFSGLNKLDIEIENQIPIISKFTNILFEVEGKTEEIKSAVNNLYNGGTESKDVVKNIKKEVPNIIDAIDNSINLVNSSDKFISSSIQSIESFSKGAKNSIGIIKNDSEKLNEFLGTIDLNSSSEILLEKLNYIKGTEESILYKLESIINFIDSINKDDNSQINDFHMRLISIKNHLTESIGNLGDIINKINNGEKITSEIIVNVQKGLENVSNESNIILSNLDTKYKEGFNNVTNKLKSIISSANKVLESSKKEMPHVKNILDNTSKGLDSGVDVLVFAKENMADAENIIKDIADKIRSLKGDEALKEAFKMLKLDAAKEGEFLSDPVELVKEKVYPVPNYGSAMSPFFSTLSLWVGGLILVSVLTTKVYYDDIDALGYSKYIGRGLTFLTIGVIQALVVTLGDIFILGTYNYSKMLFVLSGVIISMIFVSIIYTLVFVLGNVGKALGVILLVLQISSSGGTFPVEVTPSFFKMINPFMPFTYAIGLMREAVAGVVASSVIYYTFVLFLYFILFFIIGLYISRKDRKLGEIIRNKLKESGIVEK